MRTPSLALLGILAVGIVSATPAKAQDASKQAGPLPWAFPQDWKCAGRRMTMHEPQVLSFDPVTLKVSLRFPALLTDPLGRSSWGSAEASGTLHVDLASRLMRLDALEPGKTMFPAAAAADATAVQGGLGEALPKALLLRLDLLVARPGIVKSDATQPNFPTKPPAIVVRERPAVLRQLDGEPVLLEVRNATDSLGVEYLANSASDLFRDPRTDMWYLLVDGAWMQSKVVLGGPWKKLEGPLPTTMSQIPADHPRGHIRKFVGGTPEFMKRGVVPAPKEMPEVLVADKPTELVLLAGSPLLEFVPGVRLLSVANTESELFLHLKSNLYYLLVAGRWFCAEELDGPWRDAGQLPEEFAKIPRDWSRGHVVWCVPGTPEAAEACALASLEERATMNKFSHVDVKYEGKEPATAQLQPDVKYVTNTEDDCFVVGGAYYVNQMGLWYRSDAGKDGTWKPCVDLPAQLRKIAEESGSYHVNFCRPLGLEGDLANFAVSGGYYGTFAWRGAPVYGTGTTRRGVLRAGNWYPCARTYGENRWFDPTTGVFQPRSVKPRATGAISADEWSPYTASYGRVKYYGVRYWQGGRRMYQMSDEEGAFDLSAGRPDVWSLWRVGEELKKREGLDVTLFPFGDRSTEAPPVEPRIAAEESGKVWRIGAKGAETFDKAEWKSGLCPPDLVAWLALVARLDERPQVWKRWREQRASPIPVNTKASAKK